MLKHSTTAKFIAMAMALAAIVSMTSCFMATTPKPEDPIDPAEIINYPDLHIEVPRSKYYQNPCQGEDLDALIKTSFERVYNLERITAGARDFKPIKQLSLFDEEVPTIHYFAQHLRGTGDDGEMNVYLYFARKENSKLWQLLGWRCNATSCVIVGGHSFFQFYPRFDLIQYLFQDDVFPTISAKEVEVDLVKFDRNKRLLRWKSKTTYEYAVRISGQKLGDRIEFTYKTISYAHGMDEELESRKIID